MAQHIGEIALKYNYFTQAVDKVMPVRLQSHIWGQNATYRSARISAQSKHYPRLSKVFLARITAAVLVFFLSLLILPFCTDGDQTAYRKVYDALPDFGLTEGFLFYSGNIGSLEFFHFILSWVVSRFVEKDLFVAFSNAILAYVAMALFQKWKASIIIAFLIILTNVYFFAVYFTAERLKFGFIFLALSMIYIDQIKRSCGFAVLALISHVQVIIVYASMLLNVFVGQISKLFRTGKIAKSVLFLIPFIIFPLLLVRTHILLKFQAYYDVRALSELAKILVFFLLALWYSREKRETFVIFIPIFIAGLLLGDMRVNIIGYFVFLYYGLQIRGGWNFGVLATSLYFTYNSIGFLINVFQRGDGFLGG